MAYTLCGRDAPLVMCPCVHSQWILNSQVSPPAILFPRDTHQDKGVGTSAETWSHPPLYRIIWLQGQELWGRDLEKELRAGAWNGGSTMEGLGQGAWGRRPGAGAQGR